MIKKKIRSRWWQDGDDQIAEATMKKIKTNQTYTNKSYEEKKIHANVSKLDHV